MSKKLPKRPLGHRLEEQSRRFFVANLPNHWTFDRPSNDYGIDGRVDIFEGELATGEEFLVQLKAAARAVRGDAESMQLSVSTFNYLRDNLAVVMLVKYVAQAKDAYWIWLRDVRRALRRTQKTITIRVPKANRLSEIDWDDVHEYIRRIRGAKLAAGRGPLGRPRQR